MAEEATEAQKAELLAKLTDPVWRICNLYRITDKMGRDVPFVPTAEQMELITAVFVLKQKRHAILKARQMGFSTLIAIIILDQCYFGENVQASIIDQTQPHASAKLKKVSFAYERMGPLRERLRADNDKEMGFANGSNISAGKSARGSTNQVLHISEWGPISHTDPKRSEEIKTGALPTAEHGIIFNESTFKGGKGGHYYESLKAAMETPESHRTAKDFRFWFFPWFLDKGYTLEGDPAAVPADVNRYLDEKERELSVTFTAGQRLWYAKTKAEQGIFMFREYPTTVAEAFKAPVEGSIFGEVISAIRSRGQICAFEWDRSAPVFSIWDLGWDDSMSVWLVQIIGRDVHWIWHKRDRHRTVAEMWAEVDKSGIAVAMTYLPHDANAKDAKEGRSYKDAFEKAGARNIRVVPRCTSIGPGINLLRDLLQRSWFVKGKTDAGLEALEAYHTKDTDSGGLIVKDPVHDWSSHDASAARIFAEALELGMVNTAAAARKTKEQNPRYPDGSIVNPDQVREVRRRGRENDLVRSGPTPMR